MKFENVVVIVALALCLGVACSSRDSANPLRGYDNIPTVKAHGMPQPTQDDRYAPFEIDLGGNSQILLVNIVEGQTNQIAVNVRVLVQEVKDYTLEIVNPEPGMTLARSSQDRNSWLFKWAPAKGYVDSLHSYRDVTVKFRAFASAPQVSDPRYAELVKTKVFTAHVTKTQELVQIVGLNNIGSLKPVKEGEAVTFSVDVFDPASNGQAPKLFVNPYKIPTNLESYRANGKDLVKLVPNEPHDGELAVGQKQADGTFRYTYVFDATGKETPVPPALTRKGQIDHNADNVDTCFILKAFSTTSKIESSERPVCVRIEFKDQAPTITWDAQSTQITAGTMNTLKFTVKATDPQASVSVQNLTAGFKSLRGKPLMNCEPGQDTSLRSCHIEWQAPCTGLRSSYTFSLKATSGSKGRVDNHEFPVVVPESCKEPTGSPTVAAAATKSVAKKSVEKQVVDQKQTPAGSHAETKAVVRKDEPASQTAQVRSAAKPAASATTAASPSAKKRTGNFSSDAAGSVEPPADDPAIDAKAKAPAKKSTHKKVVNTKPKKVEDTQDKKSQEPAKATPPASTSKTSSVSDSGGVTI